MASLSLTLTAAEAMILPLSAIRPSEIMRSASRREHTPARAMTLAMRSPANWLVLTLPFIWLSCATMRLKLPEAMAKALAEADAAGERGEVPVGCTIVDGDGAVVASAGNRTTELTDPTAHAEMLAIRAAAALIGSERISGCDLYVT